MKMIISNFQIHFHSDLQFKILKWILTIRKKKDKEFKSKFNNYIY